MKIKSLLVIVVFFSISFAIISCLDPEKEIEYGSDDTIHAFGLDTIYGVTYPFSIDQINGVIYNLDSVPHTADTIINKIRITRLDVMGYALIGDTLFNMADSLDLSKTMEQPLKLRVVAPDGKNTKDYTLEVRIHQQDPDSLVWTQMTSPFPEGGTGLTGIKSVIVGENLMIYTNTSEVYYTPINDGHNWRNVSVNNLPGNANLSSIQTFQEKLYVVTTDEQVYFSSDGITWNKDSALSDNGIETLIAGFPDAIAGIKNENGIRKFCITANQNFSEWETGGEVPTKFLSKDISSTVYKTKTGNWKAFMVADISNESDVKPIYTIPWFSVDGKRWTAADSPILDDNDNYGCPYLRQPSIIYYNDKFYAFGKNFDYFYISLEGLTWSRVEKKVLFPKHFEEMSNYSMVVDKNNFIWIIWGKEGEVWRGRINKLGFKII
ncbi:MAG: DUF6242 domain-containing protein [Mediterranea sp.]|jgi:hypothetical protein|nr:DUF6242 domain-containing protein [Mediterranea sp.]